MKEVTFVTPNKMLFESDHGAFNRQTKCISTGAVIGATQRSDYIPAYIDTRGETEELGVLQANALLPFLEAYRSCGLTGPFLYRFVRPHLHDKAGILYVFKHVLKHRTIIDGLVLTTFGHSHLKTAYLNTSMKAESAVEEARKYVAYMEKPKDFVRYTICMMLGKRAVLCDRHIAELYSNYSEVVLLAVADEGVSCAACV